MSFSSTIKVTKIHILNAYKIKLICGLGVSCEQNPDHMFLKLVTKVMLGAGFIPTVLNYLHKYVKCIIHKQQKKISFPSWLIS